jgi:hypothetical protein
MKLFVQNSRCPSQILFAFDEITDAAVLRVRWAVAYSTRSGCERLVRRVSSRIGKKQWEKIEKHFVTSLDFGLTEPAAIQFLDGLPRSSVHIANPGVTQAAGLMPKKAYHPKLYLFDAQGSTGYVVGSANLTNSALIANTEVVAVGTEKPAGGRWDDIWAELLLDTVPLTAALLAEYRRKWKRPKKRPVDPDPKPVAPAITPAQLPVFWGAVEAGAISPMGFNHMWLEAGSMSSGGSHNQLELPRGANRFFGFTHTDYGAAHRTIGIPILTLNKREWTDRPLTWHGHNGMERINLPTLAQAGFDYRHTAVLFRRHGGRFEINVLPWNDDGAIAWRAASAELQTVFRIGENTARICGLF